MSEYNTVFDNDWFDKNLALREAETKDDAYLLGVQMGSFMTMLQYNEPFSMLLSTKLKDAILDGLEKEGVEHEWHWVDDDWFWLEVEGDYPDDDDQYDEELE